MGKSNSGFWEGGKGTRDKVKMSRKGNDVPQEWACFHLLIRSGRSAQVQATSGNDTGKGIIEEVMRDHCTLWTLIGLRLDNANLVVLVKTGHVLSDLAVTSSNHSTYSSLNTITRSLSRPSGPSSIQARYMPPQLKSNTTRPLRRLSSFVWTGF